MFKTLPWIALVAAALCLLVPALSPYTQYIAPVAVFLILGRLLIIAFFRPPAEYSGLEFKHRLGGGNPFFTGCYWIYTNKTIYSANESFVVFEDSSKVETAFGLSVTRMGGSQIVVFNELGQRVYPAHL